MLALTFSKLSVQRRQAAQTHPAEDGEDPEHEGPPLADAHQLQEPVFRRLHLRKQALRQLRPALRRTAAVLVGQHERVELRGAGRKVGTVGMSRLRDPQ